MVAVALALALRLLVVQVFFIPSSSMVPTLLVDDRIAVEKVTYRFREPARGDIIVFAGAQREVVERDDEAALRRAVRWFGEASGLIPPDPSDLVKRLIGLPGEEISIVDGRVHINGVALEEPYLTGPAASNFGPVTVPDDAYFFLGDNRRNSADSRGLLGFVAQERVIGRAVVVVWPFANIRSLASEELLPVTDGDLAQRSGG